LQDDENNKNFDAVVSDIQKSQNGHHQNPARKTFFMKATTQVRITINPDETKIYSIILNNRCWLTRPSSG